METLAERVLRARRRLIKMHFDAGIGHLGGNLSCLDALVTLFQDLDWRRDHFVLSKGHAVGALYVALWERGRLADAELDGFHGDSSLLAGHPLPGTRPEISFATGSLGHGLGQAAGLALGLRLRGENGHVFALTSDGEWQEGSTWEAFRFLRHHRLANLTVLIDRNRLQAFGRTDDICRLDWERELGGTDIDLRVLDGHDPEGLRREFARGDGRPRVLVLNTEKGHPISFLRDRLESHYLPLKPEQYELALAELGPS